MTSPSHKKPQTIPPSILAATASDESGRQKADGGKRQAYAIPFPLPPATFPLREEPLWIPAGLLAALVLLAGAFSAVGGEVYDSGWSSTTAQPGGQAAIDYRLQSRPISHQPLLPQRHGAAKIRLVAWEDEQSAAPAPRFAQNGSARLRSVVVENNGERRSFRVAQENLDDELLEGFDSAYGADQELPPMEDEQSDWNQLDNQADEPDQTLDQQDDWDSNLGSGVTDPFEKDEAADPRRSPSDNTVSPGPKLEEVTPEDIGPAPRRPRERRDGAGLGEAQKNCSEELARLKASRIAEIDLNIMATGTVGEDYPYECSINDGTPFAERCWPEVVYMWKASALCHKPLYFENVQLERYGHSWGPCLQPIMSGVHFFGRLPVLPYCMGLKAPNECEYVLGHYRPGSCAPYLIEPIPFTFRAAAWEAAAVTGGIFVIP